MFEVQTNLFDIQELHSELILLSHQLPGAAAAAVDDTLEQCREMVVDELDKEFTAPREPLDERVGRTPVERPQRQFIRGRVFLKPKRISLRLFRPKQHPLGVVYRPYTSGSTKLERHAFGPDIAKLNHGVFRREGKKRTPIKRVDGLDLTDDAVALATMEKVEGEMPAVLEANTNKHVQRLLAATTSGRTEYGLIHVSQQDTDEGVRFTGF